jgi:uncharacterized membrane protein YgcG
MSAFVPVLITVAVISTIAVMVSNISRARRMSSTSDVFFQPYIDQQTGQLIQPQQGTHHHGGHQGGMQSGHGGHGGGGGGFFGGGGHSGGGGDSGGGGHHH